MACVGHGAARACWEGLGSWGGHAGGAYACLGMCTSDAGCPGVFRRLPGTGSGALVRGCGPPPTPACQHQLLPSIACPRPPLQLGPFDGVFFDTYGEYYEDMHDFHLRLPK